MSERTTMYMGMNLPRYDEIADIEELNYNFNRLDRTMYEVANLERVTTMYDVTRNYGKLHTLAPLVDTAYNMVDLVVDVCYTHYEDLQNLFGMSSTYLYDLVDHHDSIMSIVDNLDGLSWPLHEFATNVLDDVTSALNLEHIADCHYIADMTDDWEAGQSPAEELLNIAKVSYDLIKFTNYGHALDYVDWYNDVGDLVGLYAYDSDAIKKLVYTYSDGMYNLMYAVKGHDFSVNENGQATAVDVYCYDGNWVNYHSLREELEDIDRRLSTVESQLS